MAREVPLPEQANPPRGYLPQFLGGQPDPCAKLVIQRDGGTIDVPELGLFDTLRARMFTSWDGVESLHMSCLERPMQSGLIGLTEPIPDTFGDPERVLWTGNLKMWWAAPDKWRFDTEYPGEWHQRQANHPEAPGAVADLENS